MLLQLFKKPNSEAISRKYVSELVMICVHAMVTDLETLFLVIKVWQRYFLLMLLSDLLELMALWRTHSRETVIFTICWRKILSRNIFLDTRQRSCQCWTVRLSTRTAGYFTQVL